MDYSLIEGDCLDVMRSMPDASIDSVVTDPPYPEIERDYGRLSESDWMTLMQSVVKELRRLLTPTGSAMFVLQPNSRHIGEMRSWLWDFLSWVSREWNIVQDAYWWNHTTMPCCPAVPRKYGLMRASVKTCCWVGAPSCYRNQDAVLWEPSQAVLAMSLEDRADRKYPSGHHKRNSRIVESVMQSGGVTPFNLLPLANADSNTSGGALGHGASTPRKLCSWWIRYITPPGGIVLDPFCGSGTTGVAALHDGRRFIGIEKSAKYADTSRKWLEREASMLNSLSQS